MTPAPHRRRTDGPFGDESRMPPVCGAWTATGHCILAEGHTPAGHLPVPDRYTLPLAVAS